ncbi:GLPGLI family protein [Chryseobacterium sp.]|uniref:GLPGLI family protein n=1 Tax=Chryseobacterium sp. TaxID=1871047 RepID=UPI002FCB3945
MKVKIIFIFLIANFSFFNAQINRFFYNVSFKKDSTAINYEEEIMVLDVGNKTAKFYPYDFVIKDSIRKKTGEYLYSYSSFDYRLKRDLNSNVNINFTSISPYLYKYSTVDKIDWTLKTDVKTVDGLKLQKATTKFGGRNWVAWFAPSIPYQTGPYKFNGLPGLIVELNDDKQQYIFKFVKNKKIMKENDTSFYLENLNDLKPINISEKEFKKIKIANYQNPLKDFNSQQMVVKDKDGNIQTLDSRDLTKLHQERMKRYNNPIEIDKAIPYPEN